MGTANRTLLNILLAADPFFSLFWSSVISLITSIIYLYSKRLINFKSLGEIIVSGYKLMQSSLLVLLLAWAFASILKDHLGTGQYLANLLIDNLPEFTLPLMIFLSSMIIACSTGSSWGTIAIVLPLSIPAVTILPGSLPLIPAQTPLLYPIIGALLSGSLAGAHISLIADSTVMSSTSSGSYPIDHFITQLFYALPAIIFTVVGCLINGILYQSNSIPTQFILLAVLIIMTLLTLVLLNRFLKYKPTN